MKILLVNDDGYSSQGIKALKESFSCLGEVFIVAPLNEMSGHSHKVSFRQRIKVKKIEDYIFAVDSTPADCVRYALFGLQKEIGTIDYVLSGINHGNNIGCDIFYSGTVAATREAAMNGIPSMAVSFAEFSSSGDKSYYKVVAEKTKDIFLTLQQNQQYKPDIYYNLNFPHQKIYKGVSVVGLDRLHYCVDVVSLESESESESEKVFFIDSYIDSKKSASQKDFAKIKEGYITLTPLSLPSTMVDYSSLASLF